MNQVIRYQVKGGQLIDTKQFLYAFRNTGEKYPVIVAKFIIKIKKATASTVAV